MDEEGEEVYEEYGDVGFWILLRITKERLSFRSKI